MSAPVARDRSASRRARPGRSPRSKPTLLSPQTIRSTSWPASRRVSCSSRSNRPSGPADRDEDRDRDVDGHEQIAEQPHPADRGEPQRGFRLPLAAAEHAPRAAEPLPGADQLDGQPARRQHHKRHRDPAGGGKSAEKTAHLPAPRSPQGTEESGEDDREHVQARQQPVVHGQHEAEAAAPAVEGGPLPGRRGAQQQDPGDQGGVGAPPQRRRGKGEDGEGARRCRGGVAAPGGGEPVAERLHRRLLPAGASSVRPADDLGHRTPGQLTTGVFFGSGRRRHFSRTTTSLSRQPSFVRSAPKAYRPPHTKSGAGPAVAMGLT